jgi:uncharacterized membrane protein
MDALVHGCGVLSLAIAVALAPWRALRSAAAWQAAGAAFALATLLAAWPEARIAGVDLRWSGAPLLVLVCGWPLAVLALATAAAVRLGMGDVGLLDAWRTLAWHGLLPAALALAAGWMVRRHLPRQPFVYLLGRGVGASAAALLGAAALHLAVGDAAGDGAWVAAALLALAEAMATGGVTAMLLMARRDWLATYADRLYAPGPPGSAAPPVRNATKPGAMHQPSA